MYLSQNDTSAAQDVFCGGAGITAGAAAARLDGPPRRRRWHRRPARARKSRFMGIFFPHGMAPGYWVPEQEGALPEKLPLILESLKGRQGSDGRSERKSGRSRRSHRRGTTGSDHWVAAAFSDRHQAAQDPPGRTRRLAARRFDQIIARKIGQETLLPSLQLAVEDPNSSSSNCGEGYSCSYTNSISWIDPADAGRTSRWN